MAALRALKRAIPRLHRHYETLSRLPPLAAGERDARSPDLILPYPLRLPVFAPIPVNGGLVLEEGLAADGTYFGLIPGSAQPLGSVSAMGVDAADKAVYLARRPSPAGGGRRGGR